MKVVLQRLVASMVLLVLGTGCAKDQDYFEVMNEQQAAWREMTEILKTVKDQQSMTDAKRTLERNAETYAAISKRAEALPKPPPKKVKERLQEESFIMMRTFEHLKTETDRIARLPGGPEFLKQFESTKGLLSAVER